MCPATWQSKGANDTRKGYFLSDALSLPEVCLGYHHARWERGVRCRRRRPTSWAADGQLLRYVAKIKVFRQCFLNVMRINPRVLIFHCFPRLSSDAPRRTAAVRCSSTADRYIDAFFPTLLTCTASSRRFLTTLDGNACVFSLLEPSLLHPSSSFELTVTAVSSLPLVWTSLWLCELSSICSL